MRFIDFLRRRFPSLSDIDLMRLLDALTEEQRVALRSQYELERGSFFVGTL